MRGIPQRRPSPAMVVACTALIVALAGTAVAAPVAIESLTKKEKKKVRKIATEKANEAIDERAPGLAVGSAGFAANAGSASFAANAGSVDGQSVLNWRVPGADPLGRVLGRLGIHEFNLGCNPIGSGGASIQIRRTVPGTSFYSEEGTTGGQQIGTSFVDVEQIASNNATRSFLLDSTATGASRIGEATGTFRIDHAGGVCSSAGVVVGR
jgi:hypothetical protein